MNALGMKIADKATKVKNSAALAANAMMLAGAIATASPLVFAGGPTEEVITGILSVVYLITNVLGILFVIVGFVKLVISHAQEDAPGQQKAAMFIATGLVLILLRIVLALIPFAEWVDTSGA